MDRAGAQTPSPLCNQLPDSSYLHKHAAAVIMVISCLCKDHTHIIIEMISGFSSSSVRIPIYGSKD